MQGTDAEKRTEPAIQDKLAFRLMHVILNIIAESGANHQEATAALKAAKAMVQEIDLSLKSTLTINT